MKKIKAQSPVVKLDGDEMTNIIWKMIKDKRLFPYLYTDIKYLDLGIENKDATKDRVTIGDFLSIKKYNVDIKCATIFASTRRLAFKGKLDKNNEFMHLCETLE